MTKHEEYEVFDKIYANGDHKVMTLLAVPKVGVDKDVKVFGRTSKNNELTEDMNDINTKYEVFSIFEAYMLSGIDKRAKEFFMVTKSQAIVMKRYMNRVAPRKLMDVSYRLKLKYFTLKDSVKKKPSREDLEKIKAIDIMNSDAIEEISSRIANYILFQEPPRPVKGKIQFSIDDVSAEFRQLAMCGYDLSTLKQIELIALLRRFRVNDEIMNDIQKEAVKLKGTNMRVIYCIGEIIDMIYSPKRLEKYKEFVK